MGVAALQRGDQVLDLLPLGRAVRRTGVADHRQAQPRGGLADHALADVQERADLGHAHAVEIGHGPEAGDPPLVEEGEVEGLDGVVVVVPEGDLLHARLLQGGVERPAAELGAQGAGVLLLAGLEEDVADVGRDQVVGDVQVPAQVRDGGEVHPRHPHVDGEGLHPEAARQEPRQPGQGDEGEEGVLPAGDADGDALPRRDHVIVRDAAADEAEDLLHGGPSWIRSMGWK